MKHAFYTKGKTLQNPWANSEGIDIVSSKPSCRRQTKCFFSLSKIPSHQEPCPRFPARWCLAWLAGHGIESPGRRPAQWWYWLQLPGIAVCSRGLPSHFTRASIPWIHSQSTSTDRNEEAGEREGRLVFTHHSRVEDPQDAHFHCSFLLSCYVCWTPDPEVNCVIVLDTTHGSSELSKGAWRAVINSLHPHPSIPPRNSTLAHSDPWHWKERWPWPEFPETLLSLRDMRRDCQNSSTYRGHF